MYRLLTILISFLFTAHAMRASVAIPYVFVKNYTVDDYKASCQNWGFSLTPDGMLYVANNSGLLAFDGNTWKLYSLPGQEEVTGVTNYNDTIYTRNLRRRGLQYIETEKTDLRCCQSIKSPGYLHCCCANPSNSRITNATNVDA